MIYVLYGLGLIVILAGLIVIYPAILFTPWEFFQPPVRRPSRFYTIRSTLPADGDPFDDRIEFFCEKQDD